MSGHFESSPHPSKEWWLLSHNLGKLQQEWFTLEGLLKLRGDLSVAIDLEMETEAIEILTELEINLDNWQIRRLLSSSTNGDRDAVITISADRGDFFDESCDWSGVLFAMYGSWATAMGYRVRVIDSAGDGYGGYRFVTFTVSGLYAYGYLQYEHGNHSCHRLSPFSMKPRKYSCFASVEVVPLLSEWEIRIDPAELDLQQYWRYSNSCAFSERILVERLTHKPSGIGVWYELLGHNRHYFQERALEVLGSKVAALTWQITRQELTTIRTYSLDTDKLIRDDLTGMETDNVDAFLSGDKAEINAFIHAKLRLNVE